MALSFLRGGTAVQHVILGAGPAGVIAAETIRKYAPADSIVLVGDEPDPPYSRMAIPYLLMGHIREQGTHLRHGTDPSGVCASSCAGDAPSPSTWAGARSCSTTATPLPSTVC
jgi:hypothetical protein